MLDELLELYSRIPNLVIVTGTGNEPVGKDIKAWPAVRGGDYPDALVVVGGVDPDGDISNNVPSDFVKVYALAESVEVPWIRRGVPILRLNRYDMKKGTSLSSAIVAGILATHMSDHFERTSLEAIEKLERNSYARQEDGPKVAWTGIRSSLDPWDSGYEYLD
ncbi:hypothetical protein ABW19_dt0208997 [Dactylella cylindrospora]|nr:hypothetical protein ABW19_dt0208997 [Dactylella cylindrospora]